MRQLNLAYLTGAIFGFLGVITGALGAHALESVLTPDQLDSYETAVRFQMYHALLLILLGNLMEKNESKWITYSVYSLILGTILFSGSIYVLVLTSIPVGLLTPLGGLLLIAGWSMIILWGLLCRNKN